MIPRPPRPWEIRRAAEHAAMEKIGQGFLTDAIRSKRMTVEERAEAERLIALPHGAEDNALRRLLLEVDQAQEDRRYDRLYHRPSDKSHWADVAQDGVNLAGPFATEREAELALEASC